MNTSHVTQGHPKLMFVEFCAVDGNLEMYGVWKQDWHYSNMGNTFIIFFKGMNKFNVYSFYMNV